MMEKEIITFKENSSLMSFRFFVKMLATNSAAVYINLTQYSVMLTCPCGCVVEETCKPAESLQVLH